MDLTSSNSLGPLGSVKFSSVSMPYSYPNTFLNKKKINKFYRKPLLLINKIYYKVGNFEHKR